MKITLMNSKKKENAQALEIFQEQIRELYSNVPLTTGLTFSGASIMVFLVWNMVNTDEQVAVLLWLSAFALLALCRIINFFVFSRHEHKIDIKGIPFNPTYWARLDVFLTAAYGFLFGVFFLLFYDTQNYGLFYQIQMATFLFCMILASASFLSINLPSYIALAIGSGSVVCVRLLAEADWFHLTMIPLLLIFNLIVFNFVKRINRRFKESIQARIENLDLIQALVEKKEMAEKTSIGKSRFIAAAGHNLRQPLHAISLSASNLGHFIHDEKGHRSLSTINKSVAALEAMFNNLSYISRFDSREMQSEMLNFPLSSVHQQIFDKFQATAKEKNINFSIETSNEYTYSDPELYGVIVNNLVSNAIFFTNSGSVCVSTHRQNDNIKIQVSDTGVGIAKDMQTTIFDENYPLENPNQQNSNGLGLGLALVHRLVSILGLDLQFSSSQNGTTFSLYIPIGKKSVTSYPQALDPNIPPPNPKHKPSIQGICVLIIDDDQAIRESMTVLLQQWGCVVLCADSSASAMQQLTGSTLRPKAIVSDFQLQNSKTGIDAIRNIREFCKTPLLPALIITADRSIDFKRQGLNETDFLLHKPAKPAAILAFLTHAATVEDVSDN
jgi:signal transduction histidine kinase/CheY-like chemotaxis protein